MKLGSPEFRKQLAESAARIAALPEAEKERMRQESRELLRTQWKPTEAEEWAMMMDGKNL